MNGKIHTANAIVTPQVSVRGPKGPFIEIYKSCLFHWERFVSICIIDEIQTNDKKQFHVKITLTHGDPLVIGHFVEFEKAEKLQNRVAYALEFLATGKLPVEEVQ